MPNHDDLNNPEDPLIPKLRVVIRFAVRALAVLMTLVIVWGVLDVGWDIYVRLTKPPVFLLNISDILATFGAFLAVLIAIEIFVNINLYLRSDVIHVKIVIATALMAVARKAIVLDFKEVSGMQIFALAALLLAAAVAYWIVTRKETAEESEIVECDAAGDQPT